MVRSIQFNDGRFKKEEDYNLLSPLTDNTIILCPDWKRMNSLAKEMIDTINGNAEYNNYDCDDEDIGSAMFELRFGLQMKIRINSQTITLALEPAIIYKAKNPEDIWLFEWSGTDGIPTLPKYQEAIYPMLIFKGSREVWNKGVDEVYKTICSGRYGCYDGKWVNLQGIEYDSEYSVINSRTL